MKLNHNESSSSVRHLGKCYFRRTLLNCVMAKYYLECWNWTLTFCSFYSIITTSLQAIWSFSDSSCDSRLSPRRKGHLTCFPLPNLCPSKLHLAWLLSYWLPISPLHCVFWKPSSIVSTFHYVLHTKFCSFSCVPLSWWMIPLSSCSLSHRTDYSLSHTIHFILVTNSCWF